MNKQKLISELNEALKRAIEQSEEGLFFEDDPILDYLTSPGMLLKKTSTNDESIFEAIKQWAEVNNINLVVWNGKTMNDKDVKSDIITDPDNQSFHRNDAKLFDELDKENTVFLVNDYDLSQELVRHCAYKIIKREFISNARGSLRNFDNLLFAIATVNPNGTEGRKLLDLAELSVFFQPNIYDESID